MKGLKKFIIECINKKITECGGGYSGGCSSGYYSSSSSYGDGYSSSRRSSASGRSSLKKLTADTYMDASEAVRHSEMLIKEAKRCGKTVPHEMKIKLDALVKAANDFIKLIDFYTEN